MRQQTKNSLPLFNSNCGKAPIKSMSRFANLQNDVCPFASMYISCQSKDSDTDAFFSYEKSIRDACTPQPGEIVFNTMTYRSRKTVQRPGYLQRSVTYIKVQIMFK